MLRLHHYTQRGWIPGYSCCGPLPSAINRTCALEWSENRDSAPHNTPTRIRHCRRNRNNIYKRAFEVWGWSDGMEEIFLFNGFCLGYREQTPLVEGTPNTEAELIGELREAANELRVRQRLHGWADALRTLPRKHIKNFKWLLLALDTTKNTIAVTGYPNREEASLAVSEIEKSKRTDIDAVLVWVNSIKRLALHIQITTLTRQFFWKR
jgi:hypothetical protein